MNDEKAAFTSVGDLVCIVAQLGDGGFVCQAINRVRITCMRNFLGRSLIMMLFQVSVLGIWMQKKLNLSEYSTVRHIIPVLK